MAEAFKVMILMIGLLVGVIMVVEGAIWLLHFTGMANVSPGIQRQVQFSTHMDTPLHTERFRSVHT